MNFLIFVLISKKYLINQNYVGVNKSKNRFDLISCLVFLFFLTQPISDDLAYFWTHQKNERFKGVKSYFKIKKNFVKRIFYELQNATCLKILYKLVVFAQ